MSQIKISELTTLAQQLQSADYVPMTHSGVTYKFAPFNYLVKNSGDETIAGVKTFSSTPIMTLQGGSASSVIDIIQPRKDTAANWTSVNPVLHQGEEGLETDTGKRKTGDGVTAWNSLVYSLTPLSSAPSAGNVMVWPSNRNFTFSGDGTFQIIPITSTSGGRIVMVYGYEASGGISFSSLYNIKLQVAGGGGPDLDAQLISRAGSISPYPSISFTSSGGYLSLTVSGSSGGLTHVEFIGGW